MSIEQAEKLKRELTDKWVVVADEVPELRRFSSLTGMVKTVNMNCRALVEFEGVEDISWYDIDPQFLTVVDGPRPKPKKEAEKAPAAKKAAPAAKPAAGGNPLDAIRAGAGGAKPAAGGSPLDAIRAGAGGAKPAAGGGSPLDKIRASAAPAAAPEPAAVEEEPAPAPKAAEKKPAATGSPLDQIRSQGGFKG
ncbi:MAG: hypothetical protein WBH50_18770 [Fuerstiella sp.]